MKLQTIKPGYFNNPYTDAKRDEYDQQNQELIEKQMSVDTVLIGDSITEWLPSKMLPSTLKIVNRGIAGDETIYMSKRFAADVLQLTPSQVVILGGVNDINFWFSEMSNQSLTMDELLQQTTTNILTMADDSIKQGIKTWVATVLPVNSQMRNVDLRVNQLIQQLNIKIKDQSGEVGYGVLDYYSNFLADNKINLCATLTTDGLHLNKLGYQKMSELLQRQIFNQ